jgi:hypothetical protein
MSYRERSLRKRRDMGLAQVGSWTRRAVAAGVVFCGVLGAGLADLLPGQTAVTEHGSRPATSSQPATTDESAPRRVRHGHRLAPPAESPSPTHGATHATSGAS